MQIIQQLSIAALLLLLPLAQGQAITALASLSDLPLNTTTPTQDFITENQRQYAAVISSYEKQIAEFKSAYELQFQTVNKQSDLIEAKLQEFEAQLNPLEVLSELTKHCVQKYRIEIVSIQTIKASLTSCVNTANGAWNSIISTVDSTRRTLVSYVSSNLKSALNDCQRKYNNATMNYTLCVTQVISTANTYTINNRKSFNSQLQSAKCTGNTRIDSVVDCSFSALYAVISSVGAVTRSIDNCVSQMAECVATCQPQKTHCDEIYTAGSRFAYNATLPNPFYGSNSTSPCAIVHYDFTMAA